MKEAPANQTVLYSANGQLLKSGIPSYNLYLYKPLYLLSIQALVSPHGLTSLNTFSHATWIPMTCSKKVMRTMSLELSSACF